MAQFICTKNSNKSYFVVAPAANMFGKSRFPTGCMIWQHAVSLESISETKFVIIFFPAERTWVLALLLTCCLLLFFFSFLLGQNYSKSNIRFSRCFFGKIILSPNSFSSLLFLDWKFQVQLQFYKIILSPKFILTYKNFLFLLIHSVLLSL